MTEQKWASQLSNGLTSEIFFKLACAEISEHGCYILRNNTSRIRSKLYEFLKANNVPADLPMPLNVQEYHHRVNNPELIEQIDSASVFIAVAKGMQDYDWRINVHNPILFDDLFKHYFHNQHGKLFNEEEVREIFTKNGINFGDKENAQDCIIDMDSYRAFKAAISLCSKHMPTERSAA